MALTVVVIQQIYTPIRMTDITRIWGTVISNVLTVYTSSSRYRTVTLVVVELIQTLASIQTRTTGTLIDVKLTCWSSVTRETSTDVAAILRNTLAAIITRISEAVVDKLTLSLIEPVSAVTDTDSLVILVVIHTHPSLTQGGGAHSLTGPDLTEVPRVTPPTGTGKPIHSVHTGPSIHTGVTGTLIYINAAVLPRVSRWTQTLVSDHPSRHTGTSVLAGTTSTGILGHCTAGPCVSNVGWTEALVSSIVIPTLTTILTGNKRGITELTVVNILLTTLTTVPGLTLAGVSL